MQRTNIFLNLLENTVIFEPDTVKRTDYVEKREIDHSALYSFDAPFRLFHADVGNLEFLGKNATFPQFQSTFFHQKYTLIQ